MIGKTIDITPTWGEFGNIYARLAESREVKALRGLRAELAKAMAAAQALNAIRETFTDAQAQAVTKTMAVELTKQGY